MKMEYDGVKYSHACISRNIYNEITKNIIFIGPRSGTKEEWKFIINKKILCYTSNDILNRGIQNIISDVMKKIRKNKIYLSIDMDVLDPIYCSGVGTPEPFGIHPNEIYKIIKSFSKKIIGIDIVETAPEYDNELSSVIVNGLLREFIFSSENKNI